MKITFLGTSHGVPEPHRKCSSTLIEVNGSYYIIDMGAQAIEQLINRRIKIESVKCIFITHMHGDHTDGLISFTDLCSWYYKKAQPHFFFPGDVEKTKNAINVWLECNGHSMREFEFSPVEEGAVFEDENIKVTAFKTAHIENSYAFLVEAEGKRVLFSGDLCHKGPEEDFPVSVLQEELHLAVCECAHFGAHKYLPIFKGNENLKKLCFNHYSDRFLGSILETEKELTEIPVFRATDDMEISI